MCHLRHRLRIFLFHRKVKFHSQDIQVFVFLIIPWFTRSVMSWWADRVHFGIHLLNCNSLNHQTRPSKQGHYFSGIFWTIWRTGAKFLVLFNLATCSNYSITNYIKIPVFHFFLFLFFEKVNKGHFKMVNVKQQKWPDLTILSI